MIRGVIWDIDGTLADTIPMILGILRRTIVAYGGREYSDAEIEAMFGPTEEGVLLGVLGEAASAAYATFLSEYEARHDAEVSVFDGIPDIVEGLHRRGILQAVVTGKGPRSAEITLQHLGFADVFDVVTAGSVEGQVKDEAIATIMAGWGIGHDETVYIGDHPNDVRDAHRAGVRAAVAAWRPGADISWISEAAPEVTFSSTRSLGEWLESATA